MMLISGRVQPLRQLQGLICLYKPRDLTHDRICKSLRNRLAAELTEMEPQYTFYPHDIADDSATTALSLHSEKAITCDPLLVRRPTVLPNTIKVRFANPLSSFFSGIQIVGIGSRGVRLAADFEKSQFIRVYRLSARLGRSTVDGTKKTRTLIRTTWGHVTQPKLDRLCAAVQSQYQKHMFQYAGVQPQSEEAFQLAAQGLVRPQIHQTRGGDIPPPAPVIYGLRCVEFSPPNFVLELHAVNETDTLLVDLIRDLGTELKSSAHVRSARRIRHGRFVVDENALLLKDVSLSAVLGNIDHCRTVHPEESLGYRRTGFPPVDQTKLLSE